MNRKLIFALALAMVLVSGAFLTAHAQPLSGTYFSQPACWSFACGITNVQARDIAAPNLVAPVPMGAVGF